MHVVSYLLDASSIERIDHIHPLGRPKIMVAIPSAYLHSFFPPLHLLLHHCSLVISCGRYRVSIELSSLFRESLPMTREQIRFGGSSFRTAGKYLLLLPLQTYPVTVTPCLVLTMTVLVNTMSPKSVHVSK